MGATKQKQTTNQATTQNEAFNNTASANNTTSQNTLQNLFNQNNQNTSNTQFGQNNTNPWAPAADLLKSGAGILQGYLNSPNANSVYSGQRVAAPSAQTNTALDAMGKSQGATDAMGFFKGVMDGGAGGMNPAVQQMQDAIRRQVQSATNAQFSNAGMTGGTQHQGSLAKGLADGLAQPLFAAYESDMARKMAAANALPGIDQARMGNMFGAGQEKDAFAQKMLDSNRQVWEEQRGAPMRAWSEVAPYAQQLGSAGTSSSMFGSQLGQLQGQSQAQTQGSTTGNTTSNTSTAGNSSGSGTMNGTTTSQSKQPIGNMIGGGLMAGLGLLSGNPMLAMGGLGGGSPYASNGMFDLNELLRR